MKLLADVVMISVCKQQGDGKDPLDKVHSSLTQHLAFTAALHTHTYKSPH